MKKEEWGKVRLLLWGVIIEVFGMIDDRHGYPRIGAGRKKE